MLESLVRNLEERRAASFKELAGVEADFRSMDEDRESELEERAQEVHRATLLKSLDEHSRKAVEEIDAALRRAEDGVYGLCKECGERISLARLRVLPAARCCLGCASAREKTGAPVISSGERTSGPRAPGDLTFLSDNELEEVVWNLVREDGRLDTQELRLVCRRGVVHLNGVLPSRAQHQILLRLMTDVLGVEDIVDRLRIEELPWERADRFKAQPAEGRLPWEEAAGTEDVLESAERDIDFVPPSAPTPEEE